MALALLSGVAAAAAPEHARVQVDLEACAAIDPTATERLLHIELRDSLAGDPSDARDHTRVRARCEDERATLEVDDPLTGKSLTRTIDLRQTAELARPRLLALAIAEAVIASWSELEVNPTPKVPAAGPRASQQATQEARVAIGRISKARSFLERLRLVGRGSGMALFSGPGVLFGGGLLIGQDLRWHLGWQVDAEALHGSARVSLGTVAVDVLSIGPALSGQYAWRRVGVRVGAGLRVGASRLGGDPSSPDVRTASLWGPFVGPFVTASLGIAATRWLALDLGLEAGYVATPTRGLVNGVREVAVEGAWLGFRLGLGVFL